MTGREPRFAVGDLVEYDGELWTVDSTGYAGPDRGNMVALGRDASEPGVIRVVVADVPEDAPRLVTKVIDRSMFAGDGWSWLVVGEGNL